MQLLNSFASQRLAVQLIYYKQKILFKKEQSSYKKCGEPTPKVEHTVCIKTKNPSLSRRTFKESETSSD